MSQKLPPLNSLRAFVAAAKYESFTKAASELGVTQGAVSKQIQILEDYLGVTLFERKHQSLLLTKVAKSYLTSVEISLNNIEQATFKITKKKGVKEEININTLPSLSNQWLLPKLEQFKEKYPYKINIAVGNDDVDFNKTNTDIAIRISKKNGWKNFCVEKLLEERLICVCSPKLKTKNQIKNAADLINQKLLLHGCRPLTWRDYLKSLEVKSLGVKKFDLKHDGSFQHFFMLIKAAKDGLGIALIPDFLIKNELENGSLVKIFVDGFKSGYNYYLINPKQKSYLQKIVDFKSWVKEISVF